MIRTIAYACGHTFERFIPFAFDPADAVPVLRSMDCKQCHHTRGEAQPLLRRLLGR